MSTHLRSETFVVGNRIYSIRIARTEDLRTAVMTVALDGRFEWSLAMAGWGGVSWGAWGETGYLWSARELVLLPRTVDVDLEVIRVDEDLLSVFHIDDGWLLVCETSVRRLVASVETSRLEFDVVDFARWEDGVLRIRDARGVETTVRVDGDQLTGCVDSID